MIFETGYGPSGLPHIGTWNEVARTTFVRQAYEELTGGAPTRLIAFSDDMDGLRKVPDNVPNQAMLTENLGRPLTQIPDPFGTHESFAHHNNAMLRRFLDRFGFDYEFLSATDCYTSGRFDEVIRKVLRGWDAIMGVMLPTLGEDRRKTYSPLLPISTDQRARAPGAGRGDRRRSRPDRVRRRGRQRASSNRRSAAWPSCNGRSTGRRAGSRSASIMKCRART